MHGMQPYFLQGASARNGEDVKLLPEKHAVYAIHWHADDSGRLETCKVEAYVWAPESRTFDEDGKVGEQPTLGVKTAMIRGNGFEFELISPLPGERILSRFLETRGEGIYRLAFAVKDIEQAIAQFRSKGASVIEARASTAADPNSKIAFTHPKALKGVMLELVER